ncbi:aminoglycoside phosphotransferase family protein [Phytoactinopolyspora alkaliphila]|uniref:Aminoglycoside phosphotransferase family protein n=1 Tax=Phytoactinopolyspora alkaliphila TaxID=1783498 RepID=A0A6N9YGG1_9ACTN|nr:aminoglycoside phosphotransferase family protein [Phytoactinopolyspora alkaliphila]NED94052.1 aminoglycoside phosphotransferase family protein [Phytoactinopolyspora alkaliphila]
MVDIAHRDGRAGIDAQLVERLISAQFPQWKDLPVTPVAVDGWDNRTYRLGDEMTVRLPTAEAYAPAVEKEDRWLPLLAPALPVPIPVPLAKGAPGEDFPFSWSVRRWLDGRIDVAGAEAVWDAALSATWHGDPVWFHGDIAHGNLLVKDGQLAAVIDFGTSGVGDPACDLVIAWTLFSGESREAFRAAVGQDPGTWARARGWALWKALIVLADVIDSDDEAAAVQLRVIGEVLADHRRGGSPATHR